MKLNKSTKIFLLGCLPWCLAACSDSAGNGFEATGGDDSEFSEVSVNISVQETTAASRGYSATDNHIGSGALVDELIYAIYVSDAGADEFTLAEYYQANYGNDNAGQGGGYTSIPQANRPAAIPAGQTYAGFKAGDTFTVNFKVSKDKDYRLVCWAQNSGTDAYDTSDLAAIEVDYTGALNNDESRDAFTAYKEFNGALRYQTIDVVLTRPLAQINIGTTGADYKNLKYGERMNPSGVTITESEIKVSGVANRFNALTGVATAENDDSGELTADFAWASLPAWQNMDMPAFSDSYTKTDDPFVPVGQSGESDEEFLLVKMNSNEGYAGFLSSYPTLSVNEDGSTSYLTETFKYLSMCYVMLPSSTQNGSTVNVCFNLRQNKGENTPVELTERELIMVPVKSNYRTNILGGLYTSAEEGPDPTSIFNIYQIPVILQDRFTSDNITRFYAVTLNVSRDVPGDDGLQIVRSDGQPFEVGDASSMSFHSVFTGESIDYLISVNDGFDVIISSNIVIGENKWQQTLVTSDDVVAEGSKTVKLTVCKGATAGVFTIKVARAASQEE